LSSFRIDVVVVVVVVVWKGGTTCASSSLRANEESLALVYGSTSSPAWKRGPLAPVVVVVGEGQVNLVYDGRVVAMGKVSKALWLIHFDDESNRSPPVAIPVAPVSLPDSHGRATGSVVSCSAS